MFVYYVLSILYLLIYLYNFFPLNLKQDVIEVFPPNQLEDIEINVTSLYASKFDKIVLVVIDALRKDFVNADKMPFLSSAAKENGCFIVLHVQPPTVTLPRIKSLTTGSIPQFTDVLLNLASTESLKSSFLHEAAKQNRKIVFYGDDTWLKLYSDVFTRSEGTSSFFVNDFTEVDENVTRNLDSELNRTDWDIMILHYLGLDHIGHVYGPFSSIIPSKLEEMDVIFKKLHEQTAQLNESVLILVTGDHGMKDTGGHGGATFSETHVPLVVSGIKCGESNSIIEQNDVAVTLSVLMGLNIPPSNAGKVIDDILKPLLTADQFLYAAFYNSIQLKAKANLYYKDTLINADKYYYEYLKTSNISSRQMAVKMYKTFLEETSKSLLSTASSKPNLYLLLMPSLAILFCLVQIFGYLILNKSSNNLIAFSFTQILTILLLAFAFATKMYLVLITACIAVIIIFSFQIIKSIRMYKYNSNLIFTVGFSFAHSLCLFSSSFIEEEHQIWYFFGTTLLLLLFSQSCFTLENIAKFILLLAGFRFLRTINQTGDKWASLPDFSDWLLKEENYTFYQLFFGFGVLGVYVCVYYFCKTNQMALIWNTITLLFIFIYKASNVHNVVLEQVIWMLITFSLLFWIKHKIPFANTWILICSFLFPPYNTILISYCVFASIMLLKNCKNVYLLTITHVWLGNILYFCQGHSNSLASVNIAVGYTGLQTYVPIIVIAQVLCYAYAFPILSHSLLLHHMYTDHVKIWTLVAALRLLVLVIVCLTTIIFQEHLFIWSVFAPKLLIESSHCLVLLVEIVLFICTNFIRSIGNKTR